jgi:hypothetical protein
MDAKRAKELKVIGIKAMTAYSGPYLTIHGNTKESRHMIGGSVDATELVNYLADKYKLPRLLLMCCNPNSGNLGKVNIPVVQARADVEAATDLEIFKDNIRQYGFEDDVSQGLSLRYKFLYSNKGWLIKTPKEEASDYDGRFSADNHGSSPMDKDNKTSNRLNLPFNAKRGDVFHSGRNVELEITEVSAVRQFLTYIVSKPNKEFINSRGSRGPPEFSTTKITDPNEQAGSPLNISYAPEWFPAALNKAIEERSLEQAKSIIESLSAESPNVVIRLILAYPHEEEELFNQETGKAGTVTADFMGLVSQAGISTGLKTVYIVTDELAQNVAKHPRDSFENQPKETVFGVVAASISGRHIDIFAQDNGAGCDLEELLEHVHHVTDSDMLEMPHGRGTYLNAHFILSEGKTIDGKYFLISRGKRLTFTSFKEDSETEKVEIGASLEEDTAISQGLIARASFNLPEEAKPAELAATSDGQNSSSPADNKYKQIRGMLREFKSAAIDARQAVNVLSASVEDFKGADSDFLNGLRNTNYRIYEIMLEHRQLPVITHNEEGIRGIYVPEDLAVAAQLEIEQLIERSREHYETAYESYWSSVKNYEDLIGAALFILEKTVPSIMKLHLDFGTAVHVNEFIYDSRRFEENILAAQRLRNELGGVSEDFSINGAGPSVYLDINEPLTRAKYLLVLSWLSVLKAFLSAKEEADNLGNAIWYAQRIGMISAYSRYAFGQWGNIHEMYETAAANVRELKAVLLKKWSVSYTLKQGRETEFIAEFIEKLTRARQLIYLVASQGRWSGIKTIVEKMLSDIHSMRQEHRGSVIDAILASFVYSDPAALDNVYGVWNARGSTIVLTQAENGVHLYVDPHSWPSEEAEISRITTVENKFLSWKELGVGESLSEIDIYSIFKPVIVEENLISLSYLNKIFTNVTRLLETIQRTSQVIIINIPKAESRVIDLEATMNLGRASSSVLFNNNLRQDRGGYLSVAGGASSPAADKITEPVGYGPWHENHSRLSVSSVDVYDALKVYAMNCILYLAPLPEEIVKGHIFGA